MPSRGVAPARATMSGDEVKAVLARFLIPHARTVHDFRRGSTRFAKAIVGVDGGRRYLLKRRAATPDDRARLAFSHDVQRALMGFHFPVPELQLTTEGGTILEREGHLYELFLFVEGDRFRRSGGETRESGLFLARLHKTMSGWSPNEAAPHPGGYHGSRTVAASWSRVWSGIHRADAAADEVGARELIQTLRERYATAHSHASAEIGGQGQGTRTTVIHGDFHPGNLLFVAGSPVVMIDFDAVRQDHPVIDVANGCLQFGMHPVGDKPVGEWIPTLNLMCVEGFLRGYSLSHALRLGVKESSIVASLMVEASIAESIPRIAINGTFAGRPGLEMLRFVEAKTRWLWDERDRIATLCASCMKG